jgi:peroxiredoxin
VPQSLRLPRYYPSEELVGEQFPDFILKEFKGDKRVKLSDYVKEDRVTALLFWHPNCKQCKTAMPGIVTGANSYAKWLDIISVVSLKNSDEARNAEDTIRAHKMEFPVLEDEGKRVKDLYKVLSTPTMFFIRPDGVIDSVYTKGDVNYVPVFSVRIRKILKVGLEYEGGP